jgi:aminoglycoside 3-N-acetyltransferase
MITRQDIVQGLRRAGLQGGEVVLVHSSLSRFGRVEGGAETVIAALREAVGPAGTLVLTAITITAEFTEAHVRAAMAGQVNRTLPMFNVAETPTYAGTIPETFRRQSDVVRSWHPTHSVSAAGPMAAELLADHHLRPSCGLDSPYERLTRLEQGRILLLGVSHERNTTMHTFEELAGHPYMLHEAACRIPFVSPDGERLAETTLHRWHIDRELGRLESRYIDEAAETVTLIGEAPVRLCRAGAIRRITLDALAADPFALVTAKGRRQWAAMTASGNRIDPTGVE